MKKIILGVILTVISVTGLGLNNSYAEDCYYTYQPVGNDMVLVKTYRCSDDKLVAVEVVHEDN
jgi:hypothetical protein